MLSLPTIKFLIEKKAKLIILTHLGRPKGQPDPDLTLAPLQKILSQALNLPISFCKSTVGEQALNAVNQLMPGQILLLENTRFNLGETDPQNHPHFTKQLQQLGDIFVNDAFASAHRSHASVTEIAKLMPSVMGFLMEKEIKALSSILSDITPPFYAIIGGAKIASKISVLSALLHKIHALFIGGGMAFTFLRALGYSIGDSIFDEKSLEKAKEIIQECKQKSIKLFLPIDAVITSSLEDLSTFKFIDLQEGIKPPFKGVDIGPKTSTYWQQQLDKASTIFWNGPLGIFETPGAAHGTLNLALYLSTSKAKTLIGGGDSIAAIKTSGIDSKKFDHLSTGGGATLEYIEFETLPGIDALDNRE
ncbi:phosphoglycerate kinase [Candidatus Aerophobetes bacterium]|uniref:Phosphoglycerate kinase n=1 Tax=Aerophobetes bacterium TaxID=2030807 RepID=A0A2A4X0S6_UNCAE|nr:MAG: phosphoglycerate kinase [Candidatus Aerophobetes bacterium]